MSLFDTSGGTPVGLGSPLNMYRMVYNRTGGATAIGDIVMFDGALSDAATLTADMGATDSATSNVIQPVDTAGELIVAWFGVCMEVAADDKLMRVQVKGIARASIDATYATVNLHTGRFTGKTATDVLDVVGTAGDKVIALGIAAGVTTTPALVLFDGIDGFGVK
jgi:hypothetical protein